ncbi:MAG: GNAT family N-acetyltransferase [Chloroflexota bacterium]
MRLKRYNATDKSVWDNFVADSRNGTFLFHRNYIDYHQDRFDDHSLMIYDEKDNLLALFPANKRDTRLDSHGGLTYGGFIVDDNMKVPKMLNVFHAMLSYASEQGFKTIRYKTIPHIYHDAPTEEDLYALYLCDAQVINRPVITAIRMDNPLKFQTRRRRGVKAAHKAGITARQSDDWRAYWDILEALLANVHDAEPVHNYNEITTLSERFPKNIKLYGAFTDDDQLIAGIVIYETERVARCQYIAASMRGQNLGALDYLFDYLLKEVYIDKPYFEFGTSQADENPDYLNSGLIDQKEGFGARAIMQDTYLITLDTVTIQRLTEALI